MSKLCCFPLSEVPEIDVNVNCVSTCCASDTKSHDNVDNVSCTDLGNSEPIKEKRSCCCFKRRPSKSQANDKRKKGDKREEDE